MKPALFYLQGFLVARRNWRFFLLVFLFAYGLVVLLNEALVIRIGWRIL